nr:uncharacterized protein LOC126534942 [Dermacentor andersoni]
MGKLSMIAIVVFVLNATPARSFSSPTTTVPPLFVNYSVSLFMNTTEAIWTTLSTKNSTVWCNVDRTSNITDNTIYFNRSFVDGGGKWVTLPYRGEVPENMTNIMLAGITGAPVSTNEKLVYATSNYSCGVFYVDYVDVRQSIQHTATQTCRLKRFQELDNGSPAGRVKHP